MTNFMYGQLNFRPAVGDWVKVYLPRLGVWHHGIVESVQYLGWNAFQAIVAHNMKGVGITKSYWNDFSEGQAVLLCRRAISQEHVQQMLARINRNMGKPYYLFAQNCEHFASLVYNGKAESPTVKGWGLLVAAAALIGLLFLE